MKILAPKQYYSGIYVILPVMAGTFFTVVYGLFGTVEFYHKSTVFTMVASIISAIINVGLNYIFIPKFGYIAAAYITVFCYIIYSILHFINMKRVQKEDVYDIKFIVSLSVIVVIICLCSTVLYDDLVARYTIIFIVASILRKKIWIYAKNCM